MARDPVSGGRVCVGIMVGAHGVRGLVKVKSFTEQPADVAAYGPVSDEAGRRQWRLEVAGPGPGSSPAMPQGRGDVVLVRIEDVKDREAAQALHGLRLYVPRAALPPAGEEEFYHADLIGLRVEDAAGRSIGTVKAVENHGAGDLLVVEAPDGRELVLPFTRATVPVVDLAGRRLVVEPPAEVAAPPGPEEPPEG